MNRLQLLCADAATLLATAAQAAALTLSPAAVPAQPGQTAGWGFTLLNDDVASVQAVPAPASWALFGAAGR